MTAPKLLTPEEFEPIAERLGTAGECWSVAEVEGEDLVDLVTEARRARASEAALLSDREALVALLAKFKEHEFVSRMDWVGHCPFRRDLGCHGSDGRNAAVGTPRPKPHDEFCPYHALEKAKAVSP